MRALDPGTEVGGTYVIEAPISIGGMGAVHRARRLADGLEVAIKQPLDEADPVRFRIEARLLERLRHARVVRVIDHFADGDGDYLVMDLVRGPSLDAVFEQSGPLPVAEAVEHVRQACEALAYVHEQQVVHRDDIAPAADDDATLEAHMRQTCQTIYHPTSTCRMGADDASVVDTQLRVRGVEGLRVVDASAMPSVPRGNTNAPFIAIAERASDLIRGRAGVAPGVTVGSEA